MKDTNIVIDHQISVLLFSGAYPKQVVE